MIVAGSAARHREAQPLAAPPRKRYVFLPHADTEKARPLKSEVSPGNLAQPSIEQTDGLTLFSRNARRDRVLDRESRTLSGNCCPSRLAIASEVTYCCFSKGEGNLVSVGILGRKLGMTQIFDPEEGIAIPVTVIEAGPCTVTQVKTKQTDGYSAVQIGYDTVTEKKLTRPELGHLKKSSAAPLRHLKEYRLDDTSSFELGQAIDLSGFEPGQLVDVSGTSIGRGFAGNQKRNHFSRGLMTHGCKNHRIPGSIGPGTTPGRVYPGKRMAGRKGGKKVTTRKLKVVKIDAEKNLILIKGTVPGKPGGLISIAPATIVGQKKK